MKTITRGRACAILRHENRVLASRGRSDAYWAMPGGGIDPGEFSAIAVAREIEEELGISVAAGPLLWVIECLFEYGGTRFTEFGFYYEVQWPASASVRDGEFAHREAHLLFRWMDAAQVAAVDLRPYPLKAPLLALMAGERPTSIGHFTVSDL